MEHGLKPMQAAMEGSSEIAFTVISMTLSLAAVFIPVLFMPGLMGRLLSEFAVTIGASILVSGVVSLTLTPMMASRFLRARPGAARSPLSCHRRRLRRHALALQGDLGLVSRYRLATWVFRPLSWPPRFTSSGRYPRASCPTRTSAR